MADPKTLVFEVIAFLASVGCDEIDDHTFSDFTTKVPDKTKEEKDIVKRFLDYMIDNGLSESIWYDSDSDIYQGFKESQE